MARVGIEVTGGRQVAAGAVSADVSQAAADADTAKTATELVVTDSALAVTATGVVDTDAGLADTAANTAKTDALAAQTANVAVTPVENAIALLEADGVSPTQGHVNSLRSVWDTLSAACTVHNGAANTVASTATTAKTATALVVTKSGLNVTAVGLVDTKAGLADTAVGTVVDDLAAAGVSASGDLAVDFDAAVLTTRTKVREAMRVAADILESRSFPA